MYAVAHWRDSAYANWHENISNLIYFLLKYPSVTWANELILIIDLSNISPALLQVTIADLLCALLTDLMKRKTIRPNDWQVCMTDWLTDRQTDWLTDWFTDWLVDNGIASWQNNFVAKRENDAKKHQTIKKTLLDIFNFASHILGENFIRLL